MVGEKITQGLWLTWTSWGISTPNPLIVWGIILLGAVTQISCRNCFELYFDSLRHHSRSTGPFILGAWNKGYCFLTAHLLKCPAFWYQLPRRCSWHVYMPNIESLFLWNEMHCYNRVEPQLLEDHSQIPHSCEARPIVVCSCSHVCPRHEWKNGHFVWHCSLRPSINFMTPNVNYSGRTAPLTSKVAFYIFIQQI